MMRLSKITTIFLMLLLILAASVFDVVQAQPQDKRLKKRVAVFTFEDKSAHQWRWWTGQPVGEGMADMLITALVKTGNYQVYERTEINNILEEQKLGMTGAVTQESAAKVGQLIGVELAIMGAVTEFGWSQSGTGGAAKKFGIGIGIKSTAATVAVDVRFVNTTTGEIVTAESVRKEESKKGLAIDTDKFSFENQQKFDESLVGKATRDAIDSIVEMVDKTAPKIPWQAKIIKGDGPIFINAGSITGVQVGDEFNVYRQGEELIDPDTGISLGAVESKIGRIRVVNNSIGGGKASQCEAVSGSGFERNDIVKTN